MELPKLRNVEITGDISVEPLTGRIPKDPYPHLYLIMGPTGAGKSSFIESLAGESQQLSISKNQLSGYTQSINAYRVVNVNYLSEFPVHLIDTPGFSDSKISEVEIIDMVKIWLRENRLNYVHRILFLTPITETRLSGSRRRTIEMLKQLLAPQSDMELVVFVTTMWDTLHNERTQNRAESNFAQLRDEVFKNFYGNHVTRFMNTKNSALKALDASRYSVVNTFSNTSSASANLYQDLHDRIEGALRVKQMIESELTQPETQTYVGLRAILEQNQRENHEILTKFIAQLANFQPIPKGFEEAHQRLQASIVAMQHPPPPNFPEPPAHLATGLSAGLSDQHHEATALQADDTIPAHALPLAEEEPLHVLTAAPDELRIASQTNIGPPSSPPERSPTSPIQLSPSRMLILKGLLRRLIKATKRPGKKWFKQDKD